MGKEKQKRNYNVERKVKKIEQKKEDKQNKKNMNE